jgi:filamentous hemagglutinin
LGEDDFVSFDRYAELAAGFGPSGGTSFAINDDGTIGGIGGSGPLKVFPGAGFGAGVGAGLSTTSTFVVPSLNNILGLKK